MHGVYDERGQLIVETSSEMLAFVRAIERQSRGKLTTVLLGGVAEVLFNPVGGAPPAAIAEARERAEEDAKNMPGAGRTALARLLAGRQGSGE